MHLVKHAHMMLAESARIVNRKLTLKGGGWNAIHAIDMPLTLAGQVFLPWSARAQHCHLHLTLVDQDGGAITISDHAVEATARIDYRPDPGIASGHECVVPFVFAMPVTAAQLGPGRYEWRLSVDGQINELWNVSFTVLAAPSR
jgi:hypothetical protein